MMMGIPIPKNTVEGRWMPWENGGSGERRSQSRSARHQFLR